MTEALINIQNKKQQKYFRAMSLKGNAKNPTTLQNTQYSYS
jgi:hypothetical protein